MRVKFLLFLLGVFSITTFSFAQNADAILGKWLNAESTAQIQVFKRGSNYFGRIVWLKDPNNAQGEAKTDVENPDASLKTRPIIGLEILQDFVYANDEWKSGTIYDPESGKTYSCLMTLEGNKLNIKGYIGVSLLGRTAVWTKVD